MGRVLPFVAAFVCAVSFSSTGSAAPPAGYQLTFSDEFDGSAPDTTKWIDHYKWATSLASSTVINGELEAYVDNAFQQQNGILSILGEKRQGSYAGQTMSYTSGIICSSFHQKYGYFEARMKVPAGKGFWPAFWLLGENGSTGVNEIDIHEILGDTPAKAYMTIHWGQSYTTGHQSDSSSYTIPSGPDFSQDYHVFGLQWDASTVIWSIDGTERFRHTGPTGVPQVDMYIIANLAIGGTWPGSPDDTTLFPGSYDIDYVRAYQGIGSTGGDSGVTPDANSGAGADTSVKAEVASDASSGGMTSSGGATSSGGTTSAGGAGGQGSPSANNGGGCGCELGRTTKYRAPFAALALMALLALPRRR
jgi:beta-glucanase (GH16 family)